MTTDTGVKRLETKFRRANAEQHIYMNKTSVWKGQPIHDRARILDLHAEKC